MADETLTTGLAAPALRKRALPVLYFSYGMTKCGSTLAFEMVRTILAQAGFAQPRLSAEAVADWSAINFAEGLAPERVAALRREAEALGHPVVVKLHGGCTRAAAELLREGVAQAHAVYRDPRDMALSLMDAGARARENGRPAFSEIATLDDALVAMRRQHRTLCTWLRRPMVAPLCYDDVAFDPVRTIRRLARQIGVPAEPAHVLETIERERFTQRNKAVRARHETELAPQDSARIAAAFAPLTSISIDARVPRFAGQPARYQDWRRALAAAARDHLEAPA
ncbi:sulfotransferase domain-containing protein [Limibaculum sp. FT325]|uniref:sulfotransferase domain-containing protein n=1 Tax=Thermohalobaculum sediminis TaxID=2939436 RepID=UPI0020BE1869|nr:sulfotransferase domain-containing protein [Limibaculum sediminis]MCL5775864.1 sulfotransferase domain-containing protein [Limibaculum sediminis]